MTESSPDLERRLQTAQQELAQVHHFDYRVINPHGRLEQAAADIDAIVAAEKCRVTPRLVQLL